MGDERNLEAARRYLSWPGHPDQAAREQIIQEVFDERCDFYPVRAFAEAAPCHGPGQVVAFMHSFWEAWEQWEVVPLALTMIDAERMLAHTHITAIGKGSGVELDVELHHCFWFRNGCILRLEDHITERGAREGLGL